MRIVRRALCGAVVAAAVLGGASPLAAEDEVPLVFVYDEALVVVTEELSYLYLLDRLEAPIPPEVTELPDAIGLPGGSEPYLERELSFIDGQLGPTVLAELDDRGERISSDVRFALLAGPAFNDDTKDPTLYLRAYDELLSRWVALGGPDFDPGDLELTPPSALEAGPTGETSGTIGPTPSTAAEPPTTTATVPAASSEAAQAAEAAEPAETAEAPPGSSSSDLPTAAATLGAGGLALAAIGAVLVWHRRSRPGVASGDPGPSRDDVLEAGRRILAARSLGELDEIVANRTMDLTSGTGAIFVYEDRLHRVGAGPTISSDVVERVRATGRTVNADSATVVPIVTGGIVVGVLASNGPHDAVLHELAPLVGQGIANVTSRAATEALAFVDSLTGVNNRRKFDADLGEMSRAAAAGGDQVAVAMFDVDHFKTFNDTNGHQAGDDVLRRIAQLIAENLRPCDVVYRYGGEEFAALLPGASLDDARLVVERVRGAIEVTEFDGGESQPGGRVTLSIGVATTPPADGQAIVRAADAALYTAKSEGRNRVVVAGGRGADGSDEAV